MLGLSVMSKRCDLVVGAHVFSLELIFKQIVCIMLTKSLCVVVGPKHQNKLIYASFCEVNLWMR